MTDSMLSLVPPAPAPQRVSQGSARGVVEAKHNDSDQGFKGVLKSRMNTEAKANDAPVKENRAPSKVDAASESVAEVTDEHGKALPLAGNSTATSDEVDADATAVQVQHVSAEELAVNELAQNSIALADLDMQSVTKDAPGVVLELLQVHVAPEPRPRPTTQVPAALARNDLPNTAQVAIAHAVREAMTEAEPQLATESPLLGQLRPIPVLTGGAGLEAMAARLLAKADNGSATPLQVNSAALPAVLPQDALAATRSALPTATLDVPLRQPGWDQALSERVLWVANNKFQGVELKLNPAHLGPIEVRVQMQNDQAQVSFVAQHGPVREALEAALPRLREMFAANGFDLTDVNVSQHSFAEQQRQAHNSEGRGRGGAAAEDEADMGEISQPLGVQSGSGGLGGVDLFA